MKYSGLGIRSITNEVLVQFIRKGLYLKYNPDIQDINKRYKILKKAGYRTPLGDLEYAVQTVELQLLEYTEGNISMSQFIKNAAHKAKKLL